MYLQVIYHGCDQIGEVPKGQELLMESFQILDQNSRSFEIKY